MITSLLFGLALATDYTSSDSVVIGTDSNFDEVVLKNPGVVFVEFYAPWCGHCKTLGPEWKSAAKALKGVVSLVAVDATAYQALGSKYDVRGYPTIKVFGADKSRPTDYNGARSASAIVDEALKAATQLAKGRLKGGSGGSSGSSSGKEEKKEKKEKKEGSDVVKLTADNFDELVYGKDLFLVEFYAPWCGHCKNLAPEWERAATDLVGIAKLGAVDATVEQKLGEKFGVRGYPTIKVFLPGKKEPLDYEGGRTAAAIVDYAMSKANEIGRSVEVLQATAPEDFEACLSAQVCVLAVLPHISDSGAAGRNAHIATIKEAAKKVRMRLAYYWVEAGAQSAVEDAFRLQFGFPALVLISRDKQRYHVHTGDFSVPKLSATFQSLQGSRTFKTLPKFEKTSAWDGNDAPASSE